MGRRKRDEREERLSRVPRGPRREIEFGPKTDGQEDFLNLVEDNDITICHGPAGSGKTFLSVGIALKLLKENPGLYKRIIMVRPAVAVKGEDMGYLPGDFDNKMKPYIAPMMDSLSSLLSQGEIQSLMDSGTIDVIPVAFMRGRTLNNCIVIFDEAQNSRWEHMKMFLTRLGFNTKAIVEGDMDQSDLDGHYAQHNGLKIAFEKLKDIEGVGLIKLECADIVRSPIVKRLLEKI